MNYLAFYKHIDQGALVLTPNRRLARSLHLGYQTHKQAHNKVWASAQIMPLVSWQLSLWQEYQDNSDVPLPYLLNEHQIAATWKNIIKQSTQGHALLKLSVLVLL